MKIPVFHDDQHGTAIITGAALLNALRICQKKVDQITVLCVGAGAAAVRCMELWVKLGVRRESITMFDKFGIIYAGRTNEMDPYKGAFAVDTTMRTLDQAAAGKDVLIGLSAGNVVTPAMLQKMAPRPIVFALANPDPEIPYQAALAARPDAIVATGRSDHPNQVNNVLGYPHLPRRARRPRLGDQRRMKLAATHALAEKRARTCRSRSSGVWPHGHHLRPRFHHPQALRREGAPVGRSRRGAGGDRNRRGPAGARSGCLS
jgi:malate dehydrogenase (oxaloacetate-decarboxylating)(NADP+)